MDADGRGDPSSFARDRGPVLWLVALGADEEVGVAANTLNSLCSSSSQSASQSIRFASLGNLCSSRLKCSRQVRVRDEALATMQFVPIVPARAHRKVVNGKQGTVRW